MSKFKVGDHVRPTDQNRPHYDLVGRIVTMDESELTIYRVRFQRRAVRAYAESDLILADHEREPAQ